MVNPWLKKKKSQLSRVPFKTLPRYQNVSATSVLKLCHRLAGSADARPDEAPSFREPPATFHEMLLPLYNFCSSQTQCTLLTFREHS